jgi:glycosyltransferase involved in cell wall biosynthesis
MPHVAANAGKTRKILIYGINYTPEMIGVGRFTGEIGAYLAKNGFDVCVVTAPPHYPGWLPFPPYSARRYANETRAGVKILRCPLLLRADIHGIWRLIAPLSFALTSAPVVLWKIGLVRNWVDLTQIKPLAGTNAFRAELGLSSSDFVVLYAGNIGAKQALDVVVDAARQLAGTPRVHFIIAGDGPEKQRLVQGCAGLPRVHFLPLQPEERLCELLNLADLHVLPQARGAADLVLPSKLGGMLASGKPVLATADTGTELFDVLQGTAILVPAGDSAAMAREIGLLAAGGSHPAIGDGRTLAQIFDRDVALAKFASLLVGPSGQAAGFGARAS